MVCTTGGMRTQTARLNEAAPPFPVVVGVDIGCLLLLLLVVVLWGFVVVAAPMLVVVLALLLHNMADTEQYAQQ